MLQTCYGLVSDTTGNERNRQLNVSYGLTIRGSYGDTDVTDFGLYQVTPPHRDGAAASQLSTLAKRTK